MTRYKRLCVIGLGYIGLPTSAVFADSGIDVVGVDVNGRAVESINAGKPHIAEPNLEQLLVKVVGQGNFRATMVPEQADAFILAVPTPFADNHQPDVSFVEAASRSIAPFLRPGNLVVLESTSPIGTTEQVSRWLAAERPDLVFPHQNSKTCDIHVAHCPERVLPGRILHEVVHNHRVIGGITPRCAEAAAALYKSFVKGDCHLTDAKTAEMAKLTENAYRDVNIAFANELSLICDRLEIDVWSLIKIANLHPRVNILLPGPGVGGHCIAVDPWFIVAADPENARLTRTAREVNDGKPQFVVKKVEDALARMNKPHPTVVCLGLSYKADVDDLRESPAVEIAETLSHKTRGRVLVVEPHISELPHKLSAAGARLASLEDGITSADIVVLLVDHAAFRDVDRRRVAEKIVIDTRGIWEDP